MPTNVGNQTVSLLYYDSANTAIVNKRFLNIRPTGIYSGGYLNIVDGSHASLSSLVCEITDGNNQVRVETADDIASIAVASATPYVILRWTYTGSNTDYMEILAVATPLSTDLIVGKCTFTGGGVLQGFNYSERSNADVQKLFLKVEVSEDSELKVRIRAGRIQNGSQTIIIPEQKSDLFVPPSSNKRIDLMYIDRDTGIVQIDDSGVAAVSPAPPNYNGKLVLAEITLTAGDTVITSSMIKDVRNFLTQVPLGGDESYVTTEVGGKLTLVAYSVNKAVVSRYLPAQIIPGWYVKYRAENNKTVPGDFTYGDVSGRLVSLGQLVGVIGHSTGSFLFEMKIYNNSGAPKTVSQKLRFIDDNVYFFLNNSVTPFKQVLVVGAKNEDINWNLAVGENTLQIVVNNSGGVQSVIVLLGDIINDSNVYFVGAV